MSRLSKSLPGMSMNSFRMFGAAERNPPPVIPGASFFNARLASKSPGPINIS